MNYRFFLTLNILFTLLSFPILAYAETPVEKAPSSFIAKALAGMTDPVPFPGSESEITLIYTIENNGDGPMNLGQFYITPPMGAPPPGVSISDHPAPNVLPGESTDLGLLVPISAAGLNWDVHAWTDSSDMSDNRIGWTMEILSPFTADPVEITFGNPSRGVVGPEELRYPVIYQNAEVVDLASEDIIFDFGGDAQVGSTAILNESTSNPTVVLNNFSGNGSFRIRIAPGTSENADGLADDGSLLSSTIIVDTVPPQVSISPTESLVTNTAPIEFELIYTGSNSINLEPGDINFSATGNVAAQTEVIDGSTDSPVVRLTDFTGNGTLQIEIPEGIASDHAGNLSPAISSPVITVDNTAPVLTASVPSVARTAGEDVSWTLTWAGASQYSFDVSDLQLQQSGSASAILSVLPVSENQATVSMQSIQGDGDLWFDVSSGTANDSAGNLANALSSITPVTVDQTGPVATIGDGDVSLTSAGPVVFDFTVDGTHVSNLSEDDIELETEGQLALDLITDQSGNAGTISASGIIGEGRFRISITTGAFADDLGNASLATAFTSWVQVDQSGPILTISDSSVPATNNQEITWTLDYINADQYSLGIDDLTLLTTGTATGELMVTAVADHQATVTLTNIAGDGEIAFSVSPGTASDSVDNQSNGAVSDSVQIDNTPPVLIVSAPSLFETNNEDISWILSWSGAENFSLDASDIELLTTNTTATVVVSSVTNNEATVTVGNITGTGYLDISIGPGTGSDAVGNLANGVSVMMPVTIDNDPPESMIASDYDVSQVGEIILPVSGSPDIRDFYLILGKYDYPTTSLVHLGSLPGDMIFTPELGDGLYHMTVYGIDEVGNVESSTLKQIHPVYFNDLANSEFAFLPESPGILIFPMEDDMDIQVDVATADIYSTITISRNPDPEPDPPVYASELASESLSISGNLESMELMITWPISETSELSANPDQVFIVRENQHTTNYRIEYDAENSTARFGPLQGGGEVFIGIQRNNSGLWLFR